MSTTWGTSPYATPTPVIDGVMQTPAPAPTPVPIPGLMPLPFQQFMAPQAPVPYPGVSPLGFGVSPLGFPPAPAPYLGVPPLGFPPAPAPYLGFPQAPVPYPGVPPLGISPLGISPLGISPLGIHPALGLGFPPAPTPYLGIPPVGFPQAPAPYLGVPPQGFDMQTTPWPTAGLGHHVLSPVTVMVLQQLGLREAVSRIGDAALKQRVTDNVNDAIDRTIESVTGMTLHPWFGPGAQVMIYPIAAQLALIADRYPEGAMKDALLNIAGQILQKSLAPTGEGAGRHK